MMFRNRHFDKMYTPPNCRDYHFVEISLPFSGDYINMTTRKEINRKHVQIRIEYYSLLPCEGDETMNTTQ